MHVVLFFKREIVFMSKMMIVARATIEKLLGDKTEDILELDEDEEHNNSSPAKIENKFSDDDES